MTDSKEQDKTSDVSHKRKFDEVENIQISRQC